MTKKAIPKDPAARREYGRVSVALHRAKKAAALATLQNSINNNRTRLGLPPKDFTTSKPCRKGQSKLIYLPSEEEMARMTPDQLAEWKCEERRKRKLARAREKKVAEDLMVREMEVELADLVRRVKELDDGAKAFVETVVGGVSGEVEDMISVEGDAKTVDVEAKVEVEPFSVGTKTLSLKTNVLPIKADLFNTDFEMDSAHLKIDNVDVEDTKFTDHDQKPKASTNHKYDLVLSTYEPSSDGNSNLANLFTLDLSMDSTEANLVKSSDGWNVGTANQDVYPIITDPIIESDLDFATADDFLNSGPDDFLISGSDDFLIEEGLVKEKDSLVKEEDLLFGTSIVRVFDDTI